MSIYKNIVKTFNAQSDENDVGTYKYYDVASLNESKFSRLPFSVRVLLEAAVRKCDNFQINENDVTNILNWEDHQTKDGGSPVDVPFQPARVILQDFTGVPAVVDFAAMRDAVQALGINYIIPYYLSLIIYFNYKKLCDKRLTKINGHLKF